MNAPARITPVDTAAPTLKQLAEAAQSMPFDTSPSDVPLSDRLAFREAITADYFLQLLEALTFAIRFFDQLTPADAERMRAVIAKATHPTP